MRQPVAKRGKDFRCWQLDELSRANPPAHWTASAVLRQLTWAKPEAYRHSGGRIGLSGNSATVHEYGAFGRASGRKTPVISFKGAINVLLRMLGLSKSEPMEPWRGWRPVIGLECWKNAGQPPPLMWKACNARTRATFKAELTCSNGHGVSLRRHSIAADGRVLPSVVCLAPGCSFHDFVRLKGWSAGAL